MKRHTGNPERPLWLIGDSEPPKGSSVLSNPLDSRHPARHNIWTPISHGINTEMYRLIGLNIDENKIYIRNAVGRKDLKPAPNTLQWLADTNRSISWLRKAFNDFRPLIVFTFGSFAYEFVRRALDTDSPRKYNYWTVQELGNGFRKSIKSFNTSLINVFPLLHVSIARGKYLESHRYFCAGRSNNYFNYVSKEFRTVLMSCYKDIKIWAHPGRSPQK